MAPKLVQGCAQLLSRAKFGMSNTGPTPRLLCMQQLLQLLRGTAQTCLQSQTKTNSCMASQLSYLVEQQSCKPTKLLQESNLRLRSAR